MNRLCLFFCYCLLSGTFLHAQSSWSAEEISIHFDKPFYVSGEVIWYKAYFPPTFQGYDVAVKMALWHPDGYVVEDYFLKTGGATALDGYFKLPYDLPSGMYRVLVLGTEKANKKRVKLAETFVPIYNDLNGEEQNLPLVAITPASVPTPDDLRISIELAPGPFQKRSDVRASIKVADRMGNPVAANLSVSVVDVQLLGTETASVRNGMARSAKPGYAPAELEQNLYFNGTLSDQNGQPRPEIPFAVFSIAEQNVFLENSDPRGAFALRLPDFVGNKPIQFVDLRNDSLRVNLEDGIELAQAPLLPYTEAIKNYLEWSRSRKLVYQLYNTVEANLLVENELFAARNFPPDHRVVFKEYAEFPDLFTFSNEVSTPLKIRAEKDGSYTAQMFNPDPRMRAFYQGSPIFIVDGKITRDVNFLQAIAIEKLDTLDEFFDFTKLSTYFGKLGSSGVVVLKTSIPNLRLPAGDEARIFPVHGLLPEARLVLPENPGPQQPVFKPQIFWSPSLSTRADGQVNLSFPQSDDLGTFRIEVVAQATNGAMGYGTTEYQVEW